MWIILGLMLLGFALIILDMLFVPSSVVALGGIALIAYSIYLTFTGYGTFWAGGQLLVCMAVAPKLFFWGMDRVSLKEEMRSEDGYVGVDDRSAYVGLHGVAVSDLRPSGTIRVTTDHGAERLDCIADGGYIENGSEVMITEDRGTSVVVRAVRHKTGDQLKEAVS